MNKMGKILDEKKKDLAELKEAYDVTKDAERKAKFLKGIEKLESEISSLEKDIEKSKEKTKTNYVGRPSNREKTLKSIDKNPPKFKNSDDIGNKNQVKRKNEIKEKYDLKSDEINLFLTLASKLSWAKASNEGYLNTKNLDNDILSKLEEKGLTIKIRTNQSYILTETGEKEWSYFNSVSNKEIENDNIKIKSGKVSSLKVGSETTIEDSIVKRTDSNVWLLQYKGNAKDTVAIEQKGSEFHADCCEKQGIVYKDLDKAVEAIIESKDCHYEMEKRKERAKDASESRKIREKMTEGEKIASSLEKTADATENKTENIEDKADKISKADADKITASIKSIISNVSDNFKDNSIKKQFLLKLKSEIESELKNL